MASDTPWQILNQSRLDIPGLMQAAGQAKTRRLQEMMLNREMVQQDKKDERENKLLGIMAKVRAPGQGGAQGSQGFSPQTEGGGPVSGVGGGAGSASSSPYFARPRSWSEENQGAVGELMQVDPAAAAQLAKHLDAMDEGSRAKVKERAEVVGNLALWADTPEKWDQAIDFAVQQGYDDLAAYKGKFSPAARMSAIAMAGHTKEYLDQSKPVNMAPGGRLVDPATGRVIAEAPFAPRAVTVGEGQTVVEYAPGGGGSEGGPAVSPSQFDEIATSVVPGITKTSGLRSAGHNKNVGGVPNSYHLTGEASDYVPPKGMSMEELAETLRQNMPGAQVINEGDHVHVEPAKRSAGGGPRVIAQGKPKQGYQIIPPAEAKMLGLDPSVAWQRGPTGQIAAVSGQPKASKADQPYSQSAIDAFDRAIDTADRLKNHPGRSAAVGMKGVTGGLLGGWVVPGTDAADFTAELEAMKAQVFLPMVQSMKGMGALSNAEGQKLTDAIGAISPKMSEKAFVASLDRVVADLKKYRDRGVAPAKKPAQQQTARKPSVSNW